MGSCLSAVASDGNVIKKLQARLGERWRTAGGGERRKQRRQGVERSVWARGRRTDDGWLRPASRPSWRLRQELFRQSAAVQLGDIAHPAQAALPQTHAA